MKASLSAFFWSSVYLTLKRVWVETPYFVPDPPIVMALQAAALRRVDVRLLLLERRRHRSIRIGKDVEDLRSHQAAACTKRSKQELVSPIKALTGNA